MMVNKCSAAVDGPSLCRNGFPQNNACRGYTCHGCGKPTAQVPVCMRDEVPAHLVDDAGRMRFAIRTAQEGGVA